jgi:1-deoxy-D-xylulose-5-phosphate synthase
MTGGMAFEGLNNLGHSGSRVVVVLNDNGRSYAPTISRLSESLTKIRLHPGLKSVRVRIEEGLRDLPGVGNLAYSSLQGLYSAVREVIEPPAFFEALGVRYVGPIDGHDIAGMEVALRQAAEFDGPIVVHVLTQKGTAATAGRGRRREVPARRPVFDPRSGRRRSGPPRRATPRPSTRPCSTSASATPTWSPSPRPCRARPGCLPFAGRWPDRFFDVGIAEQTAVTSAAGMAMGGLRPVVAVYSTFFSRAFDQANLDVGLHGLPVIFALDRAGITGPDGPSHHGVLDMALCLRSPGMTIFAPSSAQELAVMLETALGLTGPSSIRWPGRRPAT